MGVWHEGMEVRLMKKIEGRCTSLEQRVIDVEQHSEEHFISLEIACAEVDADRAALEKPFDGLQLDVHRINHSMERDTLEHGQRGLGIFGEADHRQGVDVADGSEAAVGGVPLQSHRMSHSRFHSHSSERGQAGLGHSSDSLRASQGRLLKINFPIFIGGDPQFWRLKCESCFDMSRVETSVWVKVASMHFEGSVARWLQSVERMIKGVS
jgi:hypothetical protein